MDSTLNMLVDEIAEQRHRTRIVEDRLRDLEDTLGALGVSLWHTDRGLRLTGAFGLVIAESFLDQYIGDFYRCAYGIEADDAEPINAHREARAGHSATLCLEQDGRCYAVMVDPRRNAAGEIVGTVGMALAVTR